jgi:hypothetical protein
VAGFPRNRRYIGCHSLPEVHIKEFRGGGAASWSRIERIVACVDARTDSTDSRFIGTNQECGSCRIICNDVFLPTWSGREPFKTLKGRIGRRSHFPLFGRGQLFRSFPHPRARWIIWPLCALEFHVPQILQFKLWRPPI